MNLEDGGAEEDRTPDLLRARQALSQLSYGPKIVTVHGTAAQPTIEAGVHRILVGLGRFERPTSPLSGVRSNQLSYRPKNSALASLTIQTSKRVGPCSGRVSVVKEVIQPQVPLRLPCYDFTPVMNRTVVSALLKG